MLTLGMASRAKPIKCVWWVNIIAASLRPVREEEMKQIALDAEPDSEFLIPPSSDAVREAIRESPGGDLDPQRLGHTTAAGWLQRALSKAADVVRGLFRPAS